MRMLSLALAATLLAAGAASAQDAAPLRKGEVLAMLSTPLTKGFDPVIDGRIWHCDGDTCRANPLSTMHAQTTLRECQSAVRVTGAFASYRSGADTLAAEQLEACNARARKR